MDRGGNEHRSCCLPPQGSPSSCFKAHACEAQFQVAEIYIERIPVLSYAYQVEQRSFEPHSRKQGGYLNSQVTYSSFPCLLLGQNLLQHSIWQALLLMDREETNAFLVASPQGSATLTLLQSASLQRRLWQALLLMDRGETNIIIVAFLLKDHPYVASKRKPWSVSKIPMTPAASLQYFRPPPADDFFSLSRTIVMRVLSGT